jgi:hypothetical protein
VDMALLAQLQQGTSQQQQQLDTLPLNTPWTLGSTDGTYAMQLALMQQQADQQNSQLMAAAAYEEINDTMNGGTHAMIPLVDQAGVRQAAPSPNRPKDGARITPSGEASSAADSSMASSNNNDSPMLSSSPVNPNANNEQLYEHASANIRALAAKRSLYQDRLFRQPSASVESALAASCEVMGFDIAEMWLRTGSKTHQLTNSHLRPTALEDSVRKDIVDVYYGEKSSERTHRLSPALCKRAKEANDVVWVTAHTSHGAEALRCSISNVRTAVAVPVCHEASNTNITIIFFSIRRYVISVLHS